MSFDLFLDPYTNDLVMKDGDFTTTQNLAESLRQKLSITLKMWQNEWFMDTTYGTPYRQAILGRPRTQPEIDAIFLSIIAEYNSEIQSIDFFQSNFDRGARDFDIQFEVTAIDGSTVSYDTPLPNEEELYPEPVPVDFEDLCPTNIPYVVESGNWLAHAAEDDDRVQAGVYFTDADGDVPNIPYGYSTEAGEPNTDSGDDNMEAGNTNDVTPNP